MHMHIVMASNNRHKIAELRALLPQCQVSGPAELDIDFSHDETGTSFAENALGKARALWKTLQKDPQVSGNILVLADDSGLVIPSLNGEPGLYSARYGDQPGSRPLIDRERYELVLSRMTGIAHREAYFVCCLALILGDERFVTVQETWEGHIAAAAMDDGQGFGYDPIFWLPEFNCTVACLPPAEKNQASHRGKAVRRLLSIIQNL